MKNRYPRMEDGQQDVPRAAGTLLDPEKKNEKHEKPENSKIWGSASGQRTFKYLAGYIQPKTETASCTQLDIAGWIQLAGYCGALRYGSEEKTKIILPGEWVKIPQPRPWPPHAPPSPKKKRKKCYKT